MTDFLNVNNSGQLLNSVEEVVPLFDARLILSILAIWSVGHHDAANLKQAQLQSDGRH